MLQFISQQILTNFPQGKHPNFRYISIQKATLKKYLKTEGEKERVNLNGNSTLMLVSKFSRTRPK